MDGKSENNIPRILLRIEEKCPEFHVSNIGLCVIIRPPRVILDSVANRAFH